MAGPRVKRTGRPDDAARMAGGRDLSVVISGWLLAASCGGGAASPGPAVPPSLAAPVPGGGFEGEPIAGALAVSVVDAETGAGISGAEVRVGPADDPVPCVATTGLNGGAVFDWTNCFNLQGTQTVTAFAYGRAVTTWRGVNATQLTLPLAARAAASPSLATVTGSIAGWPKSSPRPGHRQFATLAFSLAGPRADLEERLLAAASSTAVCLRTAGDLPLDCPWRMSVPAGRRTLAAFLFDVDLRDPADSGDDVTTMTGLAVARGLDLAEGGALDDVRLIAWPDDAWASLAGDVAAPPAGLSQLSAVASLVVPGEGRLRLPEETLGPGGFELHVPQPTRVLAFGDATLDVTFRAASGMAPESARSEIRLPVADVTSRVAVEGWLAPPADLKGTARRLSWQAPAEGAAQTLWSSVVLEDPAGPAWNVVLLDEEAALALPVLARAPLSGGSLTSRVTRYAGVRAVASPFAIVEAAARALRTASMTAVLPP